mgnify:CR=1 FL=1
MVKSMTGYGRAVETVNGREFTVEVRSVNNRYLDCTVKLPRGLSFGEDAVKQAVKATISRGKVDVFVSVRSEGAQDTAVSLNKPMVEGYLAALKQLQADYGVTGEITVSMLAGLPDVFLLDKPQVDEAQLLFSGGQCFVLQVQLLSVDHAMAARTSAQRAGGRHADLRRNRRICDHLKSLSQQHIASQHRCRLAEGLVAGGAAPAQIIVIHAGQIIVDQRVAMQHLHGGSKLCRCLHLSAQHITDAERQNCTDALSTAQQTVAGGSAHL